MMKGFAGFPEGKMSVVPIPGLFFAELLPQLDHIAELKVTLHIFWRLSLKEGKLRYILHQELHDDALLLSGLAERKADAHDALDDGLERAVARGTLLHVVIETANENQEFYFMNTEKGRTAVADIEAGRWRPTGNTDTPLEVHINRPNIFTLYEQNIGAITPLLSEDLQDAEKTYPAEWIEEAIRLAVENNARSWRYVRAILDRWQKEGKTDDPKTGRPTRRDSKRYYD